MNMTAEIDLLQRMYSRGLRYCSLEGDRNYMKFYTYTMQKANNYNDDMVKIETGITYQSVSKNEFRELLKFHEYLIADLLEKRNARII